MKVLVFVTYATLFLMVGIIGYVLFNLLYDYNPITITNIRLDKTEYRQGDQVQITMDTVKRTDVPCRVTRQLVDGILYSLPTYRSNMPVGTYTVTDTTTSIPPGLPPGTYHIVVTLEYDFPPLRTVVYSFATNKFVVK